MWIGFQFLHDRRLSLFKVFLPHLKLTIFSLSSLHRYLQAYGSQCLVDPLILLAERCHKNNGIKSPSYLNLSCLTHTHLSIKHLVILYYVGFSSSSTDSTSSFSHRKLTKYSSVPRNQSCFSPHGDHSKLQPDTNSSNP